jgi:translation initiation factor 4E
MMVRKGFYCTGLWTKSTGKPFPGGGDGNTAGGKGRSTQQGQEILLKVGKRFKDILTIKEQDVVEFSGHVNTAYSSSTRAKSKFSV